MLGRDRKETLKGTLCRSTCLSPQLLQRSVLLLPEEEMCFHSPSGLCCYLFPSSVPNSPMNFSEKPQLLCQGPGTNIKIIQGGKNPRAPWVSFSQNVLLIILTCLGLFFICLLLSSVSLFLCRFFFPSLCCFPKHKLHVYDTKQSRFLSFWVFFF